MLRRVRQFFHDVRTELSRITWPTRPATLKSTGVVLVFTLIMAVYLGLIDLGLSNLVEWIIH